MSKVIRKSKTREKISAQYGVADLDPADLDIRQTRHAQYLAIPHQLVGLGEKEYISDQGLTPLNL